MDLGSNDEPPGNALARRLGYPVFGASIAYLCFLFIATHAHMYDVARCVQKFAPSRRFASTSARVECAVPAKHSQNRNPANEQQEKHCQQQAGDAFYSRFRVTSRSPLLAAFQVSA